MRPVSRGWLLIEREAIRLARRPATWIVRLSLTTFVCATVMLGWAEVLSAPMSRITSGDLGRPVFMTWLVTMWMCLVLLAPLISALAVLEEQEESTLELLALTGIRPAQLVLGKVGSRVLVLFTCVVGTAPLVSSVLSLGGVGPLEVVSAVVQMVWLAGLLALMAGTVAPVMEGLLAPAGLAWAWVMVGTWLPAALLREATSRWTVANVHPTVMASLLPMVPSVDGTSLGSLVALSPVVLVCLALQPVAVLRGTGSGMWRGRWESRLHYAVMATSAAVLLALGVAAWRWGPLVGQLSVGQSQLVLTGGVVAGHIAALAFLMTLTIEGVTQRRARTKATERPERSGTMGANPLWWRSWATDGISPTRSWTAAVALSYVGLVAVGVYYAGPSDELFNIWLGVGVYGCMVVVSLTAAAVSQLDLGQGRGDLLRVTTMSSAKLTLGQLLSVASRGLPLAVAILGPWGVHRVWLSVRNARMPVAEEDGLVSFNFSPREGPPYGEVGVAVAHALDVIPVMCWVLMVLSVFAALGLAIGQRTTSPRVTWVLCASLVPTFLVFQVLVAFVDVCMKSDGDISQLLVPLFHPEVWSDEFMVPAHLVVSTLLWGLALIVVVGVLIEGWRPTADPDARAMSRRSGRDTPAADV